MSADLFAEFADFAQPPPANQRQQAQPPAVQHAAPLAPQPLSFANTPGPLGTARPSPQDHQWQSLQNQQSDQGWGGFNHGASASFGAAAYNTGHKGGGEVEDDNDEDGWGDFEVAPNMEKPIVTGPPSVKAPVYPAAPRPGPAAEPTRTRIVRASTIDLMTNNLIDIPGASELPESIRTPSWAQESFESPKQPKHPKPTAKAANSDPNVLFDADDFDGEAEDDGDDFGEFETVASPPSNPPVDLMSGAAMSSATGISRPPASLLSTLSLNDQASAYPQAPKSPSYQERNPFPGLALATPPEARSRDDDLAPSPVTAWPSLDKKNSAGGNSFDDGWGAFEDFPKEPTKPTTSEKATESSWDWEAVEPTKATTSAIGSSARGKDDNSSWDWDPIESVTPASGLSTKDEPPPTNVPPPSILLSAFPQLLGQANTALFQPLNGKPPAVKSAILSDPKTIAFLRAYLRLATVAARIIAGRKLRWHRDKFLSQGMSISAAGSKGMKLAGIDKTQATREDREATDIVSVYEGYLGRLRSTIATANSSIKIPRDQLKIPELRDKMPVQTAKGVPTATKACCICGLKRDERVSKVDFEVEDSFDDWWLRYWGHTDCKRFWVEHEQDLRQR